jgi:uncharacterized protein
MMAISNLVFAASFDCTKDTTRVEKLICGSEEISKLDSSLGNAYAYILGVTNAKVKRDALIADQKAWIKNTRDKCGDLDCLRDAYWTRIGALTSIKTDKLAARYVVDQNERSAMTAEFQGWLNRVGITGTLTACDLMIELADQECTRDRSYGAICSLNGRTIMVCNDTMIGNLTLKLYGFAITAENLAYFTKHNCPCGG